MYKATDGRDRNHMHSPHHHHLPSLSSLSIPPVAVVMKIPQVQDQNCCIKPIGTDHVVGQGVSIVAKANHTYMNCKSPPLRPEDGWDVIQDIVT